ncbi:MAG: hypothetical protein MUE51_13000 [Thermoleophilia bacterium]|nr:hypothetical protein [Thermoleophilia bacterium]
MRAPGIALLVLALAPGAAAAAPLGAALDHLAALQDPVTGAIGAGAPRGPAATDTAWAALAVAGAGEHPAAWRREGATLADAVAASGGRSLAEVERLAVAAAAAGLDPRDLGGRDLVAEVLARQGPDGAIGGRTALTAWGIFALRAGGLPPGAAPVRRAAAALIAAQGPDGGWAWRRGAGAGDVTDTASAVQALAAAGLRRRGAAMLAARRFLIAAQRPDGGFAAAGGGAADVPATAWAAMAVRALGERADAPPWSRGGGPLARLAALQGADGALGAGALPAWVTAQAGLALAGARLPVRPPAALTRRDPAPRVLGREPAGGDRVGVALIVRFSDGPGAGVDPARVRVLLGGADLTAQARITPFSLQLPAAAVPPGPVEVTLTLADRAGNGRVSRWTVVGPPAG